MSKRNHWLAFILLTILALRLSTLGVYPLIDSTEGRYANIARQMIALDNWIVPHLNPETPFWGKPPLSFWATACSFKLFGFNEFAARLPGFLFSLGTTFLVMILTRRLYGWTAALRAAIILNTCGLFYAMSAGVLTDPALMFCITLSSISFVFSVILKSDRWYWGYLFFAGLGLGVLAKGLVGIILPGVAIGVWVVFFRGWSQIRRLPWLGGMLLFFVIAVPWHLLAENQSPGFINYYIVGEHFLRFVDKGWDGDLYGNPHEEPKGMIWLFGLAATLPWSLIVIYLIWRLRSSINRLRDSVRGFLLAWFFSPILFFTLSDNVIITYVLSSLPAFAIGTERMISCFTEYSRYNRTKIISDGAFQWRTVGVIGLVMSILANLGIVVFLRPAANRRSQRDIVTVYEKELNSSTAELIYFDELQYSGDFYSKGKAILIDKNDTESLNRKLSDGEMDFYVVDDNDVEEFRDKAWKVRKITTIGEYTLFSDSLVEPDGN